MMGKDGMDWHGHNGWMMLIAGILIVLNVYWIKMNLWAFLGVLLALFGLKKIIMHSMCCKGKRR